MRAVRLVAVAAAAIATIAGMWFVWAFTSAMVLARSDPGTALARWPVDTARAGRASALVLDTPTRAQAVEAARLAGAVLARTPVSAEAARDVALSRLTLGDYAQARAIIGLGEALSRRDLSTQMWLIEDSVQAGDIAAALTHYDRALRTSPDGRDTILPVLARAANDPAIARPLAARLAARPEWWSDFLGRFVATATSPVAVRLIVEGLRLDPASDIDRDWLGTILARLVTLREYGAARAIRDRAVGSGGTPVVDGGFERDRGLQPFDWQLVDEADRSAVREQRDGAGGAVALSVAGTEGKEVARQLLVLEPGRYRLQARTGNVSAGMLSPPVVSLRCADAGAAADIAAMPFPIGVEPRVRAASFTVPAACKGQWLSIASASNVGYLGDSPWIDDITIRKVGDAVADRTGKRD